MGTPTEPKPAKFFVALLAANALLAEVERDLVAILDVIDDRSEIVPWTVPSFIKKR
jgi:hypothetical protein